MEVVSMCSFHWSSASMGSSLVCRTTPHIQAMNTRKSEVGYKKSILGSCLSTGTDVRSVPADEVWGCAVLPMFCLRKRGMSSGSKVCVDGACCVRDDAGRAAPWSKTANINRQSNMKYGLISYHR